MKLRVGHVAAVACVALFTHVTASANENQLWLAVATNGAISEESKWRYWFDGHARSQDDRSELGVSIIRPGIGYQVSDNVTVWGGYGRIVARRAGPDTDENRIWQQATYPISSAWWGGKLTGRTRLEQRLIEGADDTGHRVRQSFRWSRPIRDTDWSWVVSNEIFIAFNNTDFGQRSGYAQNRAYLGAAWQLDAGTRAEISYLNNHIDGGSGSDRTNHNLALALFF